MNDPLSQIFKAMGLNVIDCTPRQFSDTSLNDLMVIWDCLDGERDQWVTLEEVHAELNRRGHGYYCAC